MPADAVAAVLVADLILAAPLAAWLAVQKGRSAAAWFALGAIAGPLALLALGLAPASWETAYGRSLARICPACGVFTPSASSRCHGCGSALPSEAGPAERSAAGPAAVLPEERGPGRAVPAPERAAPAATQAPDTERTAVSSSARAIAPAPVIATAAGTRQTAPVIPLATAAFAGGSRRLSIGDRYMLGVTDDELVIMGPVGVAPDKVALSLPRDGLDAAGLGDQLAITGTPPSGDPVQLEFRRLAGTAMEHLLAQLEQPQVEPPEARTSPSAKSPTTATARPTATPAALATAQLAARARAQPAANPTPPDTPPPSAPAPSRRTAGPARTVRKPTR